MSDSELRELDRRWRETGAHTDRQAYALALKRTGQYEAVAKLYSPLVDAQFSRAWHAGAQLRHEYFTFSPVREADVEALEEIVIPAMDFSFDDRAWLTGSALKRTSYADIEDRKSVV